jgi:hypothetical protein
VTLTGVSNSVNVQHYGASLAQASVATQRQNVGVSTGDMSGVRNPNKTVEHQNAPRYNTINDATGVPDPNAHLKWYENPVPINVSRGVPDPSSY